MHLVYLDNTTVQRDEFGTPIGDDLRLETYDKETIEAT